MKVNKELVFNLTIVLILWSLNVLGGIILKDVPLSEYKFSISLFTITLLVTSLLIYYINYIIFIPKFIIAKKYFKYILAFIVMCFIFAVVRFFLEEIVVFNFIGSHNYYYDNIDFNFIENYLFDSFYYTLRICLLSGIISLIFRYKASREKIHQLELENKQAQLFALKSQISPHFLFNTLNNFYVELIDEKPETADDILKLSNLLRYVTYESSDDFLSLQKELDFIKDYLHFYKRRYEDNLHIHLSINGLINNQQIPALVLIHFIENVCKHGIINDKNRPAKIEINILDVSLEIITENYINPSEKYMEGGIGTENIKKRLDVIFDKAYSLTNYEDNNVFKSYFKIPLS